jgi:GNAT superfamily N-acetyltransferase
MSERFHIRPVRPGDYPQWRPLWDGYNDFYQRRGPTAVPEEVTQATWERFFDPAEPASCGGVGAFVAEDSADGGLAGFTHYLYHRSTSRMNPVCYLQDLFTAEGLRGQGIARRLIGAVYDTACAAGASRVYWQTHVTNARARLLYDKIGEHQGFIVYVHEL